jgi:Tfp pilus assembly protein PilF
MVSAFADVTINWNLKDGDTVKDFINIRAMVVAPEDLGINKVELLIDDQSIGSKTSTPYEFAVDTVNYTDGSHKITAVATDDKGGTTRADIHLNFDNGLALGADKHAQNAVQAIDSGDLAAGAYECRTAMKIDPTNTNAICASALLLQKQGNPSQALELIDKIKIPDDNTSIRAEQVSILLSIAGKTKNSDEYLNAVTRAVSIYRQVLGIRYKSAKTAANDNDQIIQAGDYQASLQNWNAAVQEYKKYGRESKMPVTLANRLALAYLNNGQMYEGSSIVRDLLSGDHSDSASRALMGMYYVIMHQPDKAREAVIKDVDANATAPADGVRTTLASWIIAAYADLEGGNKKRAAQEVLQTLSMAPDIPEVQALQAYLGTDRAGIDTQLFKALGMDPTMGMSYAILALNALANEDKANGLADAQSNFALQLEPGNVYCALTRGLDLINQEKLNEAEKVLSFITPVNRNTPDYHMVMAFLYMNMKRNEAMGRELKLANKMDDVTWGDVMVPESKDLCSRLFTYRYFPMLYARDLYPDAGTDAGK